MNPVKNNVVSAVKVCYLLAYAKRKGILSRALFGGKDLIFFVKRLSEFEGRAFCEERLSISICWRKTGLEKERQGRDFALSRAFRLAEGASTCC